jgi:hypothetical protein
MTRGLGEKMKLEIADFRLQILYCGCEMWDVRCGIAEFSNSGIADFAFLNPQFAIRNSKFLPYALCPMPHAQFYWLLATKFFVFYYFTSYICQSLPERDFLEYQSIFWLLRL